MSDAGTATSTGATATAAGGTTATEGVAATTTAAAAPWYATRNDAEFTGYLQNRGWDKKTPDEVAFEASKAHRAAEKMIGAPANELLRLPKDPNAPEWNAVHERLGRPDKPEGYDFKDVKFPDGSDLDDNFAGMLRGALFKGNVAKELAPQVAKEIIGHLSKAEQAGEAETQAKLSAEHAALKKSWGGNYDANNFVATQGAAKLGLDAETLKAMAGVVGAGKVMEAMRLAGMAFGEDRFIANRAPGSTGAMTKEQAKATLVERRADTDWAKRFMSGDLAAKREFEALTELMAA